MSGLCGCAPRMSEWETAAPAVAETPDIKLFGKWSTDDVQINDISLQVSGARGWGARGPPGGSRGTWSCPAGPELK